LLSLILTLSFDVSAKKNLETEAENTLVSKSDRYIKYVYDKLKFQRMNKLSFEVFKKGFHGYLNMLEAGKIMNQATLSICDFSMSSNEKRLWVIDIKNKKVLFNSLVAHGSGTGEEFATEFSNTHDSHQSSLGFYSTGEIYEGSNGYSLKLNGLDGNFNNNAFDRGIVIHAADYVSEQFAKDHKRIGRSHGCPALPVELSPKIIDRIQGGHCLFIYYASEVYLRNSYWLNNRIANLPREADLMDLNMPIKSNPRYAESIAENPSSSSAKNDVSKNENLSEVKISELSSKVTLNSQAVAKGETKDDSEDNIKYTESGKRIKQIMIINIDTKGSADTTFIK
jgi:hypothetical protein